MNLLRRLSRADVITLLSSVFTVTAFRFLLVGDRGRAIGLLCVAIVGDHLDGIAARRWGGSPYGTVLDSLFDSVTYLAFPAISMMLATDLAPGYVLVCSVMVACGILRLARFTTDGFGDEAARRYVGMPVFYLGFVPLSLHLTVPPIAVGAATIVASGLMISEVPFAKPRGLVVPAVVLALGVRLLVWR